MREVVKEKLKECGMTQKELARRTGIPLMWIGLIANNRTIPTNLQMEVIAKELVKSPDEMWPLLRKISRQHRQEQGD